MKRASHPAAWISATTAASASSSRGARTTLAPGRAVTLSGSAPMPRPSPLRTAARQNHLGAGTCDDLSGFGADAATCANQQRDFPIEAARSLNNRQVVHWRFLLSVALGVDAKASVVGGRQFGSARVRKQPGRGDQPGGTRGSVPGGSGAGMWAS